MIVLQERVEVFRNSKWQNLVIFSVVVVAVTAVAAMFVSRSYGVHMEVIRSTADIGIPGVMTSYSVRLRNYTAIPIAFEGIQLQNTYPASGVWHHYRVERWDAGQQAWHIVAEINPTALGEKKVVKRLWPGGTLYPVTWEATAARDAFKKGDRARFVIFSSLRPADSLGQKVFYSPAFNIEETPLHRSTH